MGKAKRNWGRFVSVLVLATMVAATLSMRPALATSPLTPQQGGACVGGAWCFLSSDGTMRCEESERCESEGDTDEGDQGCIPGSYFSVLYCDEHQRCAYSCEEDGTWLFLGCIPVMDVCDGDLACYREGGTTDPTCWNLPDNETPCEDLNWGAGGIQCLGEYGLNVSASVPCQRVGRIPYPRGMVIVPNRLWITADSPAWVESWSQTLDYNACLSYSIEDGDRAVRNYRIGLAWGRIGSMPPYWEVEDAGTYQGWSVGGIVWERSSWGKPECGPGLHRGERLPAYRVHVYTYWQPYWRRIYERQRSEVECVEDWRCSAWGVCNAACDLDGDGINDEGTATEIRLCDTDSDGDGIPDDECWETVDSGWQPLDLRAFGYPTSYFVSTAAGPAPTLLEPNPDCSGVCVPVIEVQGVIRNPRGW
jgi:hypothetical protein